MSRLLVVDDEPSICWGLTRIARAMGLRVDTASSAEQGIALASAVRPDVLLLDVRLPGLDGLTAMAAFRQHIGNAPIIVMTAFGDLNTAFTAVAQGAFEYVVKPFELAEIRAAIERALRSAAPSGNAPPAATDAVNGMLGETPVMHAVFKRIALASDSEAPILLQGESGVGKDLAARAIHRHSVRRHAAFVSLTCAALNPLHAEVELFGRTAGADPAIRGLFVQADGGTLFLDEVGSLTPALQAKVLQALDQGEVTPLGGDQPVKTTVRVISATRHNLHGAAQTGEFRQDLLLRLASFVIELPPLRERRSDIPLLARCFAAQINGAAVLAEETLAELERRPWHGNVRELRSAIEHALVVARRGVVLPRHLPEPLPALATPPPRADVQPVELEQAVAALAENLLENPANSGGVYDLFLEEVEPPLLATALQRHGNRCAPAARALGLHRTTLKRKLDQYGIDEGAVDR